MLLEDNFKIAHECFKDARITDELCHTSIKKYSSSIRKFFSIIEKPLSDLTNSDFDTFILSMRESGAGNTRIANVIAAMKWVLLRLELKGKPVTGVDVRAIRKPRSSKMDTNYLTEREVHQFLEVIRKDIQKGPTVKNLRFMALITFLLQTGARIGEALSVNRDDLDRINNEVSIIGKGNKPRKLYLRNETFVALDEYLKTRRDNQPALFATQDGTSRWQQTDVGRSFRKFKRLSGIQKHFVIHTLRHTFATQYLMRGAGINVVQTALGHSDPVTTLKYYAAAVEGTKVRAMINDKHFDYISLESISKIA